MSLKYYDPITPSSRFLISVDRSGLWAGRPVKSLVHGLSKSGGRNNYGRITARHRGGGHKKLYRIIDFRRSRCDSDATVVRLEYDPNRTAFIALLQYNVDAELSYILAPNGLKVGDVVSSGDGVAVTVGNCLPLLNIPIGTIVHNVELKPMSGGQLARSAGSYAVVVAKNNDYAHIKLSSKEVRLVPLMCKATVGVVSNIDCKNISLGKAGRNRWLGRRSSVRGVAMNPVDHPHGGGEGKTSGGRHPVSPWGKLTKGKKTRSKKLSSRLIVTSRSVS